MLDGERGAVGGAVFEHDVLPVRARLSGVGFSEFRRFRQGLRELAMAWAIASASGAPANEPMNTLFFGRGTSWRAARFVRHNGRKPDWRPPARSLVAIDVSRFCALPWRSFLTVDPLN